MTQLMASKKLMLVRNDNIGDYVLFRQALHAFRHIPHFADWHITLYGNAVWEELARSFDANAFDRFVPLQASRLETDSNYLQSVMAGIAAQGYDCAINPLFSRTVASDYMILASNAPQRIGFAGDTASQNAQSKQTTNSFYTQLLDDPAPYGHESLRNQGLVRLLGLPEEAMPPFHCSFSEDSAAIFPQEMRQLLGSPLVFLGGTDAVRRWPGERFGAMASFIFHRTGRPVVLAGGNDALEDAAAVFRIAGERSAVSLIGKTSLPQLALLIYHAPFILTGDSCAAHFAACFQTPHVVLAVGNYTGRFLPYPRHLVKKEYILYPPAVQAEIEDTNHALYHAHGLYPVKDIDLAAVMQELELLLAAND